MTSDGKQREAMVTLAEILCRRDMTGYATPWLPHEGASARFCVSDYQLKPCARIVKKTMSHGVEYEVNVFFGGRVGSSNKIESLEFAKQIADLMLRQFGVILTEHHDNQEDSDD